MQYVLDKVNLAAAQGRVKLNTFLTEDISPIIFREVEGALLYGFKAVAAFTVQPLSNQPQDLSKTVGPLDPRTLVELHWGVQKRFKKPSAQFHTIDELAALTFTPEPLLASVALHPYLRFTTDFSVVQTLTRYPNLQQGKEVPILVKRGQPLEEAIDAVLDGVTSLT